MIIFHHESIITQNVLFPIIYSRPETSFSWFLNPWKAFRYVVCRYYRWRIICCIVCLLLLVLGGCAIYAFPGYMVKRLLGAWIVGLRRKKTIRRDIRSIHCSWSARKSGIVVWMKYRFWLLDDKTSSIFQHQLIVREHNGFAYLIHHFSN